MPAYVTSLIWPARLLSRPPTAIASAAVPKSASDAGVVVSQCPEADEACVLRPTLSLPAVFRYAHRALSVRSELSCHVPECVSQSKRFMSAEAGWQYGMRQRQMSAKDMTYAFRPNTSYRSPATQATALARANMELGSLVEARKDEAAFLFAAKMKEEGITPNATTYEHLLMACRNSMLAETSWAVFEDMITVGLEPTITHFHHMLMVSDTLLDDDLRSDEY